MKVVKVYETGLAGNRTALKTDGTYTPYVLCTNYNPSAREGCQWDSAYGYYQTFADLCRAVVEISYDSDYDAYDESAERWFDEPDEEVLTCADCPPSECTGHCMSCMYGAQ